jgi:hypothetical protein
LFEFGWVDTYFDGRIDRTDLQPTIEPRRIVDSTGKSRLVLMIENFWALLFFRAYTRMQAHVNWQQPQFNDSTWYRPFGVDWPGVPWHSEKNAGFAMAGGAKNNWDTSEGNTAITHLQNNLQLGSVCLVRTVKSAYHGHPIDWLNWIDQSIGANHVWAVIGLWQDNGIWNVRLYNPWGTEKVLTWSGFDMGFEDITMVTQEGIDY